MPARKPRDPELEPLPQPGEVDALLEGLGDDANYKIEISRVTGPSGTAGAFLDAITPQELPDIKTRARDEWGTGTYLVKVTKNGRWYSQARFSVEGRAKVNGATHTPPPAAAPAAQADSALVGLLDRLFQKWEDLQKQIIAAIQARQAAGDPFDQFQKIAAIIKETRADAPQIGAQQLMEVFKQGVEAAKTQYELAGAVTGKSSEGGLFEFAARFFETPFAAALGQGIAQIANLKPPGAPPAPGAPVNGVQQPQPRALPTPAAAPGPAPAQNPFEQAINYLVDRAGNNSSPALQAEWLFDLISEEGRAWLIETPNILDVLAAQYPQIAPHRPWFTQLVEEFRKYAQDDGTDGEKPAGELGNSAHAAGANP